MGIPFYFASLLKSHAGIVESVKRNSPLQVDVFAIDGNCLIHRYLKDEDPIHSILSALEYILENVCKSKTVLFALDGIVPYAKIVQQRYRRMRVKETDGPFDRNQISPQTPYMKELEKALKEKFPTMIFSCTDQPGEGEHKVMNMLKEINPEKRRSICIYGLDADLILICLKNSNLSYPHSMSLLRESSEFNDPSVKQAEFATLSIWKLKREIPMDIDQYLALSILCFGNDFMPNLGIFSLREDGYDRALHFYNECGSPDLTTPEGRRKFLSHTVQFEYDIFKERILHRKRPEEKAILGKDNDEEAFAKRYYLHILDGVQNIKPVVEAFWKTFHWTYNLFQTNTVVNWSWVYPYADAPLVFDLLEYVESHIENSPLNYHATNHLQFILPKTSLRIAKRIVKYQDEIYSETRNPWMKRHDWEMKPRISLPWNPDNDFTTVLKMDF